jgi:hypothetical protein
MGSCVVYLPLLVMIVALLLGLPIAFSLATAGIVGIYLLGGDWTVVLRIPGTTPFGVTAEHILTTIPMFIFMAYVSASGGLARDLFTADGLRALHPVLLDRLEPGRPALALLGPQRVDGAARVLDRLDPDVLVLVPDAAVELGAHGPLSSSMTLRRSGGRLSYFFWFMNVNSGAT